VTAEALIPQPSLAPTLDEARGARQGRLLLATLHGGDLAAVSAVWGTALGALGHGLVESLAVAGLAVIVAATSLTISGMYRSSTCASRRVERQHLAHAAALSGGGAAVGASALGIPFSALWLVLVATSTLASLLLFRTAYKAVLTHLRRSGRLLRPVIIIGGTPEADALARLLAGHPEQGLAVRAGIDRAMAATPRVVLETLRAHDATGLVVPPGAIPTDELDPLVWAVLEAGFHVHLGSGFRGVAQHRIRPHTLGFEPVLHVAPLTLTPLQERIKRVVDLLVGASALVVAVPVCLLAALAIKLEDGGPIVFRQVRIGRDGVPFTLLKLRTMAVDAEERLATLRARNDRDGPLFKLVDDPRVTAVGRILRATSIDELPQIVNVLRGEMSIVGPRPALPVENETFSAELRTRTRVHPGLTGLWQVRGRDDPSFEVFERLDLYYVRNWSVALDLFLIVATAGAISMRVLRTAARQLGVAKGNYRVLD
jgi:exopolysaccharide biosynthesis polyprenyl glycosylphosphotransferase